jgi:hypothetical protein
MMMNLSKRIIARGLSLALMLALSVVAGFAQQGTGTLRGQVTDEFGGALVGATVTVVSASGAEKSVVTNDEGIYVVTGLAPGAYTVRAVANGFAVFEATDVQVVAGRTGEPVDIKMSVTIEEQKVTISGDQRTLSTESENNADALVLRGKDLEALPDDPEDLAAALTALSGPSVGPNGGQIYIDGFTGGRLPPKEAIREVRVSQNPLNAENDRPGFGRVDILTRPGYDKLRGSASFQFNDESMNARNPFAPRRADFQTRLFSFTLSGPVSAKKSSFFLDFQRREEDDNDIVNALILDPSLNIVRFNQVVLQPKRFLTFSPRFDYAFNQNHTLIARYTYTRNSFENQGVGGFSLFSRAFNSSNTQHTFQLTETAVLNPKVINETRFQYTRNSNEQEGDNAVPTIHVLDSFTGGGSQVGLSFNNDHRWELQNYSTATVGSRHVLRFGVRLRGVQVENASRNNFGGTFIFRTIDEYRLALQGDPAARPTQFTLSGGEPLAEVSQTDFGAFIQDEWRLRPNFTVTTGLRYEWQSNIDSKFNFAPRIFFAWAPGGSSTGQLGQFGAGQPKFVVRGGFGIFYDRFNESGTLQATRFSGLNQLENQFQFNVTGQDPVLANVAFNQDGTVSNMPTLDTLLALGQPQVNFRVANNLQAPYTMLSAINMERQLPYNFTVFGVLISIRQRHALLLRDINAPLPGNPDVRPDPTRENIFQWESSGFFNMTQLMLGIRNQISPALTVFANYGTGKMESNTDCVFNIQSNCSPSNSYNVNEDIGRVSFFPRHNFFLGGVIAIPKLKLSLNPFIVARTGQFFNITTGSDTNGDRLFLERPAFASASTLPENLRSTPYGDFDINPAPGARIIPRNYGEGPGFFSVNLGISRAFGFGDLPGARPAAAAASGPRGGGGGGGVVAGGPRGSGAAGGGGGGGQRGPGGGPGGAGGTEKRYNLTFSVNIQNLFNRTNLATPVGNLSSPLFGESLRTLGGFGGGGNPAAGNRRVQASIRLNF